MSESATAIRQDTAESAPRLNRRQAAKVRTRQKVLDAARNLFAERGYEPATIRDIAKGAGMSTGAVFANFQDKAELFEAVLSEDLSRMADVLRQGAAGQDSVRSRLLGAVTAGYHSSLDQLPLVQAVVARSWFQPLPAEKRAREPVKGMLSVIDGVLREGVREGELSQDTDTRLLGEMLWDGFLSNYRKAAYDGWSVAELSDRAGRQIDVLLAGALTRKR